MTGPALEHHQEHAPTSLCRNSFRRLSEGLTGSPRCVHASGSGDVLRRHAFERRLAPHMGSRSREVYRDPLVFAKQGAARGSEDPSQAGGRCHPRRANAREHLKHEHRSLNRCYFPPPNADGLCDWACASPHSRSPAERLIDPARAGYSTPRIRTDDHPNSAYQRNHLPMAISFRRVEMRKRLTM